MIVQSFSPFKKEFPSPKGEFPGLDKPGGKAYYDRMKPAVGAPAALTIREVLDAYREDLEQVEGLIQKNLDSSVPLLNQIAHYILESGGKRIRPLLVVVASRLCGYTGRDHTLIATLVEFIHTATLLHDDVIDQGEMRRGRKAARAIWGNHPSILVGDYLYVSAATHSLSLNNSEVNYTLLGACRRMIEGEMIQFSCRSNPDTKDEEYLRIIQNKTASLISAACRLGAVISNGSEREKGVLSRFGMDLGTAFQVADDTLDYTAENDLFGKTVGNDLAEGKITLPLLHLLGACSVEEKATITRILSGDAIGNGELGTIRALMQKYGSVAYSMEVAHRYVNHAKALLDEFEDSPHKRALQAIADYVVSRDH
jgi:octaprenyl-diphosphate synthase